MSHQKWGSATRGFSWSDYKTDREEEKNLGILLHVGKLLEVIGKYGDYEKEICPIPPKILAIS
jgi:hypothetical protein